MFTGRDAMIGVMATTDEPSTADRALIGSAACWRRDGSRKLTTGRAVLADKPRLRFEAPLVISIVSNAMSMS